MNQTLNLKKDEKGSYYLVGDNFAITIFNNGKKYGENFGKDWTLSIGGENKSYLIFHARTKKECVKVGTKWVLENL